MKIRRRGRHTSPSQVEKVAAQAGKAAPAVAIAGALVAVPAAQQALAATSAPGAAAAASTGTHQTAHEVATANLTAAHVAGTASAQASRSYAVRSGDTLSAIAARFYHNPGEWQAIYRANAGKISNPNVIYVGERISIPVNPSAPATTAYHPKHAKPTGTTVTETKTSKATKPSGTSAEGASHRVGGRTTAHAAPKPPAHKTTSVPSGNLSCSGLERLWDAAGGNPAHAFIAAEIAMAESGGRQYAHSPTNDFGYWQINGSHGSMATYDPMGNARAAISISSNGTHWTPWTTYTSGAYQGRC
jgi:LysM repeat protein